MEGGEDRRRVRRDALVIVAIGLGMSLLMAAMAEGFFGPWLRNPVPMVWVPLTLGLVFAAVYFTVIRLRRT